MEGDEVQLDLGTSRNTSRLGKAARSYQYCLIQKEVHPS